MRSDGVFPFALIPHDIAVQGSALLLQLPTCLKRNKLNQVHQEKNPLEVLPVFLMALM